MGELMIIDNQLATDTLSMDEAFAKFLRREVANGDASEDTLHGYRTQIKQWVEWCRSQAIDPVEATTDDVIDYRQYLNLALNYKASTIAYKLTIIRQFYAAAVNNRLRLDNPATGVRPPQDKRAQEDFHYLSEVDYTLLLRAVKKGDTGNDLRDKAMLTMMGLQGLCTVEIERANVEDLKLIGDTTSLLVRGKNHDRVIYLRSDVENLLSSYLEARGTISPDDKGTPLFVASGNRAGGKRISRRGIRQVVDFYLKKADLKRPGISDHALRHTAATLAYKYTQDLRGVQEMLGHADPKTTARYAHVIDRMKNNLAMAIQIDL